MNCIHCGNLLIAITLLEFLITGCQVQDMPSSPTEVDITAQQHSATLASSMVTASETALPTSTNPVILTPTPLADQRVFAAWQTQVALATPVRTPVIPANVGDFPKAYVRDGNIYFITDVTQS